MAVGDSLDDQVRNHTLLINLGTAAGLLMATGGISFAEAVGHLEVMSGGDLASDEIGELAKLVIDAHNEGRPLEEFLPPDAGIVDDDELGA